MSPNPNLAEALKCLEKRWSIIPIEPKGKKPLIPWVKYQTELASREVVEGWWRQWPEANVGIVTGKISNLVVIDIDIPGKEDQILEIAPTGRIAQTGSGGKHLFYQYPLEGHRAGSPGIKNRVKMLDGVDVRGDGGYVVAPPSVHPSGGLYSWVSQETSGRVSERLLKMLLDGGQEHQPPQDGEHWLTELLCNGADIGERNNACTRLAGYLASKRFPKDVAFSMLQLWNSTVNSEPLAAAEVQTVIESVFKKNKQSFKGRGRSRDLTLTPFWPYMTEHVNATVDWVIDGWLPDQTIAFLVAAPGSFKTWLLLDLALSVASGTDFLGMFPTNQSGPVLLFQQEDHHGGIAQRLNTIFCSKFSPSLKYENGRMQMNFGPNLPIYIHPDRSLHFDNENIMDMLEAKIAEIRPKLVLIDPLYSAVSMDEYMARSTERMFRLKTLRDEYGCTFVIAHHTKKKAPASPQSSDREDLWGTQFLNAFLETGWQIRATKQPNCILVRRHFKVSENKEELYLKFQIDTDKPSYKVTVEDAVQENMSDQREERVLEALEQGPKRHGELSNQLEIKASSLSRVLERMVQAGIILRDDNKIYHLPSK
jgi:hypothetical protein